MTNPALYDPSMIVSGIIGVAVAEVWQKAKDVSAQHIMIKQLRHKFKLDDDEKIRSFDALYALALIEYGVGRERAAIEIFKNKYVRVAFENFFSTRNDEQLRHEVDEIVSLKEEVGAIRGTEYDYRRDIDPFKETFFSLLERYRTPQEVMIHHKLDNLFAQENAISVQNTVTHSKLDALLQGQMPKVDAESHNALSLLRWLHLSDFHVGEKEDERTQLFERILENVRAHIAEGKRPDLVFITGDAVGLTDTEKDILSKLPEMDEAEDERCRQDLTAHLKARYEIFTEHFLFPLIECMGDDRHIFIVPGDQDILPFEGIVLQKHGVLKNVPRFLSPRSNQMRRDHFSRFKLYVDNDLYGSHNHWLYSNEGVKVEQRTIRGTHVGILLINTAWLAEGRDDEGQLSPGKDMVREGLKQLENCDMRFVLGHHPVEWFVEEDSCHERSTIRDLFKQYHVFYLHGHLVKNVEDPIETGFFYQPLAAGASFITQRKDRWRTRILYGEFETGEQPTITVEALKWELSSRDAKVDTSAIPLNIDNRPDQRVFHLPFLAKNEPEETKGVPQGWKRVSLSYLDQYRDSTPSDMLHYFDGRRPNWKEILVAHIQPRKQVGELIRHLEQTRDDGKVLVTAFIGPAGEGKSTIVQQVVRSLVEAQDNWNIWWREDNTCGLRADEVYRISSKDGPYLIVADDAESVIEDVFNIAHNLVKQGRHNIQFLLCCRSIDWDMAEKAAERKLRMKPPFVKEMRIAPLTTNDAKVVIDAWYAYKGQGRKLQAVSSADAVAFFMESAKKAATNEHEEGTLLGAMLDVRYSPEELRLRIYDLLLVLDQRTVPGSKKTLLYAFASIAAAHVRHLPLPIEVLTNVFQLDSKDGVEVMKKKVVSPLCDEAVTSMTSRLVFIRHYKIADVAMQILTTDDHFTISEQQLYTDLLQATSEVFRRGAFSPSEESRKAWIESWNVLPRTIFEENQQLGIELVKAILQVEQNNLHFYVKLSQMRRERQNIDDEEDGRQMFMDILARAYEEGKTRGTTVLSRDKDSLYYKITRDRAFFYEWATFTGAYKQDRIDAWLAGLSLADEIILGKSAPSLDSVRIRASLVGLGTVFLRLYAESMDSIFARAYKGAKFLAYKYFSLDSKEKASLAPNSKIGAITGAEITDTQKAVAAFADGVRVAYEQISESDVAEWIGVGEDILARGGDLRFESLISYLLHK